MLNEIALIQNRRNLSSLPFIFGEVMHQEGKKEHFYVVYQNKLFTYVDICDVEKIVTEKILYTNITLMKKLLSKSYLHFFMIR